MAVIRDFLFLVLVLGGAILGSQVPTFVDAYSQRLGGALDELREGIAGFETAARIAGISFEEYRVRLRDSEDEVVRNTGVEIDRLVERAATLAAHRRDLDMAGVWTRPLLILTEGDRRLIEGTWRDWSATLTLDPRWGLAGLFTGWLLHAGIGGLIGLVGGPPRRRGGLRR